MTPAPIRSTDPTDDCGVYGKYRGLVVNNVDPKQMGRLQVQLPDVLGITPSSWAMPSTPLAGQQTGLFAIPPVGSGVWVEFEQGDPNHPIWSGGFFGAPTEAPAISHSAPPGVQNVVLQTQGQTTLVLSDAPGPTGGILLKTLTGAFIQVNDTGITISNGKGAVIRMTGNAVMINGATPADAGLTVT
jgi:uncharacterized protein involved in type VI secretion and phage assembly